MDRGLWLTTPGRRALGPPHPPCPYLGDERGKLQAQAEPANQPASANRLALSSHRPRDFDTHGTAFNGTVLLRPAGTISLRP